MASPRASRPRPCRLLPLLAALLLLPPALACAPRLEPDLERLYADLAAREKRYPLIFLPGVLGSRLVDRESGEEVWPGSLRRFLPGASFADLALPVSPQEPPDALVASELFLDAVGRDFYGRILRTLTGPGGYTCATPADAGPETDCFLFPWDWRRDLVEAAAELDALVERIRSERGNPALKFDLVAHSAGGLVARYFLRFGGRDVLDAEPPARVAPAAASRVRKAVLIGTPSFGSVSALQRSITGSRLGLAVIPPEVIATMPSLYQLLPHPDRSWMIDARGERLDRDLYAPETWRRYGWSIWSPEVRERVRGGFDDPERAAAHLEALERYAARAFARGRRFHRALSAPLVANEASTQYVVFGGDCLLTPAKCLLERVDGEVVIRLHPDEVENRVEGVPYEKLMLAPGDGRVTKASLLARDTLDPEDPRAGDFPLSYAFFVCEEHDALAGNVTFRDNLLNILLY